MELQFGNGEIIKSDKLISLEKAQQNVTISFPGRLNYNKNDLFTLMMRDLDVNYIHLLVINTKNDLRGKDIFNYLNPKYIDRKYSYEIYKQNNIIQNTNIKNRKDFNINEFLRINNLI